MNKLISPIIFIYLWIGIILFNEINQISAIGELNCLNFTKDYKNIIADASSRKNKTQFFLEPLLHDCMDAHNYNKRQVPLKIGIIDKPFQIFYSFQISEILDLDSGGQLTASIISKFRWEDEHRIWKLDEIPIDNIFIPSSEVWYPRFQLDNCESQDCYFTPNNNTYMKINNQGVTRYSVMKILESSCDLNLIYFPFDQQLCNMSIRLTSMSIPVIIIPEQTIVRLHDIDSDEREVLSVK